MDENTQHIIYLIQQSELDQTIKDILTRDLEKEGLTEFLAEQIRVYCLDAIKESNERIEKARQALSNPN
jgi:pimeloyl-CoA synthetase